MYVNLIYITYCMAVLFTPYIDTFTQNIKCLCKNLILCRLSVQKNYPHIKLLCYLLFHNKKFAWRYKRYSKFQKSKKCSWKLKLTPQYVQTKNCEHLTIWRKVSHLNIIQENYSMSALTTYPYLRDFTIYFAYTSYHTSYRMWYFI